MSLFSLALPAQYKTTKLKMAEGLFEEGKYFASLKIYIDIANTQGDNPEIILKIAQLNERLFNYVEAARWYYELYEIQRGEYPKAEFKFAELIMMQGKYRIALEHFESFLKSYRGHDKATYSRLCKSYMTSCSEALEKLPNAEITVKKVKGINSVYTDLSPFVFDNHLYFASIPTDTSIGYTGFLDSAPSFQIFRARQIKEGTFDTAVLFIPEIIQDPYKHNSSCSFSSDGSMFFFTKCKQNIDGKNICKIYCSLKNDTSWNEPVLLSNEINSRDNDFSSTHPAIMSFKKGGRTPTTVHKLIFASNMPGGTGGYDLWMTTIDTSLQIGRLENLGRRVNTNQNELTPYYSPEEEKLYFSSNGHGGLGGLDIYESPFKNGRAKKINALDRPINSSWDDWYYSEMNSNYAFMVSNRKGAQTYHNDIRLDDIFIIKKETKKYLSLYAYDKQSSSNSPLNEAIFYVKFANDKNAQGKNIKSGEPFQIIPNRTYEIIAQKNDYFNQSTLFSTSNESKSDSLIFNFNLQRLQINQGMIIDAIYFETNSTELKPESMQSLNRLFQLLLDNPSLKIEIGGHTDNQGTAEYNLTLSEKRAQRVMDYLVNKGIGKDILSVKGYGNSKPLNQEKNSPINRRIEYKVISTNNITGKKEAEAKDVNSINPKQ